MIKIHQVLQNSPEWQKLRKGLYTGSNADKLLKFGTIDYAKTDDSVFDGTWHMKRGHILENQAINLYERIKKIKVDRPGFVTNSKYPNCGYSPDGLLEDRLIEVKCFEPKKHKEVAESIPFEIQAQCRFGMFICEKKLCDLILYNPDLPAEEALIIIPIKSNPINERNFKRILA